MYDHRRARPGPGHGERRVSRQQWALLFVILALAAGALAYQLFVRQDLDQTAALFIGLPAILAMVLVLTPEAKTVTGLILQTITLALLLAGIIFGQGVLSILMAAPLFYLVGVIIATVVDYSRRIQQKWPTLLLLVPLGMFSLEGINDDLSFSRDEKVTVTRRILAPPAAIEAQLASTPRFNEPLPLYLSFLPRPHLATGVGLQEGDERVIHFDGGEGNSGELVLRVEKRRPDGVTFARVSDTSRIAHWLDWQGADVTWKGASNGKSTDLTWTMRYKRLLDPAWYFGPWERYAVGLAAKYLVETTATPRV